MIKTKTILILIFTSFLFNHCGYTPQYSKDKYLNFSIDLINVSGDRDFNNYLKSKLNPYIYNDSSKEKNFKISLDSFYEKIISLKNSSGVATEYELKVTVKFNINLGNVTKEIKMIETFNMNKMNDTFEENNYERTIKDNFANIVKEKLIFYLLEM